MDIVPYSDAQVNSDNKNEQLEAGGIQDRRTKRQSIGTGEPWKQSGSVSPQNLLEKLCAIGL